MEKLAFAHASDIIIASASNSIDGDGDSFAHYGKALMSSSVDKQQELGVGVGGTHVNESSQLQESIEGSMLSMQPKEMLTIGFAEDSIRQSHGTGIALLRPDSPQNDTNFNLTDHDPLYRIMCHESERDVKREQMLKMLKDYEKEKAASTGESRRVSAELVATSTEIIRSYEVSKLRSFLVLPSRMWVTVRVTYYFIICYASMVKEGLVIEGPSPFTTKGMPQLSSAKDEIKKVNFMTATADYSSSQSDNLVRPPTSNSKSNGKESEGRDQGTKKKGKRMFGGKEDFITAIKTVGLTDKYPEPPQLPRVDNYAHKDCSEEEYRDVLQAKVSMHSFWGLVSRECDKHGINLDNALELFSWELVKNLMGMKDEFAYALYMIEDGGAFEDDEMQSDFYSRFPESRLGQLREATRHQSFNPAVLAMLNPPAARLCAWARRVVAGIYSVKQASMRIPLSVPQSVMSVPGNSVDGLSASSEPSYFNDSQSLEERASFHSTGTATTGSLMAKLNIGANTSIQRLEQIVAYRPVASSSQSSLAMNRVVVCVDGSTSTHSSFLVAMALGRPLDCITILAVRKPNMYGGGFGGPAALSSLRSHYQSLVHNFSNSPSHRVFLPHELVATVSTPGASVRKPKSVTVSFSSVISSSHDIEPQSSENGEPSGLPPPAISNFSSSLVKAAQEAEGVEGIMLRSITTSADMCIVGMGWGRGLMSSESVARVSSAMAARSKPLALVIASPLMPRTLSPTRGASSNNDKPLYKEQATMSFTPSRFLVCVRNSASSRAAFLLTRSLAKPCDLVFLIHLSVSHPSSKTDPANVAHSLVSEYKKLGHNLHVEPLNLSRGLSRSQKRKIIATQLRRTAAVFEPTFVVLGSSSAAAHKIVCGPSIEDGGAGPAIETRGAQPGASFLEEDSEKGNAAKGSESLTEEVVVGGGGLDDLHALAPPSFSYILAVNNSSS